MNMLKAAIRLRKDVDGCLQLPDDIRPAVSLKRSNAKLRKRGSDPSSSPVENQEQAWEASHSPVEDDNMFRFGQDSRENSWERNKQDILSSGDQGPKAMSRLFSKIKTKPKRGSPPDNFTKWDDRSQLGRYGMAPHPSNLDVASNISLIESAISGEDIARPSPSDVLTWGRWERRNSTSASNSSEIKGDLDHAFPLPREDDRDDDAAVSISPKAKGKEKMPRIRDIDWSDFDNKDALHTLLASYNSDPLVATISPTDSGIDVSEGELVDNQCPTFQPIDRDAWSADQDELSREIEATTRMWSDRLHALQIHKEQELERLRQEEEDRRRAEELAELERLERERQEEEDRQRALEIQAEEERKAAELARRRDCICCDDNLDPDDFPLSTTQCEHEPQTCQDCMHQWLSSEFTSKGCSDLRCPECPQQLSYADVQRLASQETCTSYEKRLTNEALSSLEEFAWCLNPEKCDSGQLNEDNNNFMDCVSCGYKQCLKHKCAWHTGETCEQYDYRTSGQKQKDEEEATEKMIDSISKKCPGNNCGWRIQKTDGCDHMTCKKCKWEFCWECLASHREIKRVGNTAHLKSCKFHSDNLETAWPFNVHT